MRRATEQGDPMTILLANLRVTKSLQTNLRTELQSGSVDGGSKLQ